MVRPKQLSQGPQCCMCRHEHEIKPRARETGIRDRVEMECIRACVGHDDPTLSSIDKALAIDFNGESRKVRRTRFGENWFEIGEVPCGSFAGESESANHTGIRPDGTHEEEGGGFGS